MRIKRLKVVKIRRSDVIWRHFQNFDDVIAKSADVIIICDELWVQNIFFLKEDVSTFKMRGQAFSYDNPLVAICIICTTGLNVK